MKPTNVQKRVQDCGKLASNSGKWIQTLGFCRRRAVVRAINANFACEYMIDFIVIEFRNNAIIQRARNTRCVHNVFQYYARM